MNEWGVEERVQYIGTPNVNDSKTLFCPQCVTNQPVACMFALFKFCKIRESTFLETKTNVLDEKVWIVVASISRGCIYYRLSF